MQKSVHVIYTTNEQYKNGIRKNYIYNSIERIKQFDYYNKRGTTFVC